MCSKTSKLEFFEFLLKCSAVQKEMDMDVQSVLVKCCWVVIFLSLVVSSFLTESVTSFLPLESNGVFRRPTLSHDGSVLFASTLPNLDENEVDISSPLAGDEIEVDRRPFEQRTKGPRSARRMNHGFRYLYRTTSHLHSRYY